MRWFYEYYFPALWLGFVLYWQAMAQNVKATARLESASSRTTRAILFLCAIALLVFQRIPLPWLYRPLWPEGQAVFLAGAVITAAGLGFAIWARRHLGSNWSRAVTVKQGHELITSGPYAVVRHPIYTGILAGFLGTTIALGQVRGVLAFVLVFVPLLGKLRLEERWMREKFGASYETYRHRVRALVPWIV